MRRLEALMNAKCFENANHNITSVLAGFSNDLVPRTWNEFDRAGFDAVQSSFVAFTRHCYSEK
jgi:hypothetical protein